MADAGKAEQIAAARMKGYEGERRMRQFHHGAEWHMLEVRYVREHVRV